MAEATSDYEKGENQYADTYVQPETIEIDFRQEIERAGININLGRF